MNIHELSRLVRRPKKRVGRGHGSGKVKTSGRGTKGQKARGTIPRGFEGGQLPLIKRMPFLRGKGRNRNRQGKAFALDVTTLGVLPEGTQVTIATLTKHALIDADIRRVKIVGGGTLPRAFSVSVPCSKSAKAAIEKAGGTVPASS